MFRGGGGLVPLFSPEALSIGDLGTCGIYILSAASWGQNPAKHESVASPTLEVMRVVPSVCVFRVACRVSHNHLSVAGEVSPGVCGEGHIYTNTNSRTSQKVVYATRGFGGRGSGDGWAAPTHRKGTSERAFWKVLDGRMDGRMDGRTGDVYYDDSDER